MLARSHRLPGFRFEVQAPPLPERLPRMDIAVFVGFAASGPLHTPVVVEEMAHFLDVFGDAVPLAWDSARGEYAYSHLAPTIRSFFRNGGRRCWIIRVAGEEARYNHYPVPGLARVEFRPGVPPQVTPAYIRARSEGSWSDALKVGTALMTRSVGVAGFSHEADGPAVDLELASSSGLAEGDLLRLTFRDTEQSYAVVFPVRSIKPIDDKMQPLANGERAISDERFVSVWAARPTLRVKGHNAIWFRGTSELSSPPDNLHATWGSLPFDSLQAVGEGLWYSPDAPPDAVLNLAPQGEVLNFELWVRRGDEHPTRLPGLAFAPAHPLYWGKLPTDAALYGPEPEASQGPDSTPLWHLTASPRFPLSAPDEARVRPSDKEAGVSIWYLPVGMEAIPTAFSSAVPQDSGARERDGLTAFSAGLFLDEHMWSNGTETLISQADYLRYESPSPQRLKGIYAALDVDEATLIAVPDATHRQWSPPLENDTPTPPEVLPPPERPSWWRFLDCDPPGSPPALERVSTPERGNFLNCDLVVLDTPVLQVREGPDPAGTFTLDWSAVPGENVRYVLEEASGPRFDDAHVLYSGTETQRTIYGHAPGVYYYHVRAELGEAISDWSAGRVVQVGLGARSNLELVQEYRTNHLLDVHRSLLRMCAARGDMVAVLSVPEHFRENAAISYVNTLKASYTPDLDPNATSGARQLTAPLGGQEAAAFSYGAMYHPWLVSGQENAPGGITRTPPDGAACGVISQRALTRGAWIAPANVLYRGVVALEPKIPGERWLDLQTAQLNIVRQEARGFLTLSAATLSNDPDLEPINVRRLLILLRRLALRHGTTYVFEPNSPSFRRLVQRGFESLLEYMFERGAFAGATRDSAFKVTAGSTPQEMDIGKFVVELKVAPSLPMTFLTVRLVQAGDRAVVTEEL